MHREMLVRKHKEKERLGNCTRKMDNIKVDLKEIGWEVVDWIYLTRKTSK